MSAAATARLGGWPCQPVSGSSEPGWRPGAPETEDPEARRELELAAEEEPRRGAPAPGEWIAGRYRIERVLARGGMGLVVEAEHALLGKRVALKLLRQEIASDEGALQRFLDEARIAAQLPGDHIARALDFGRTDGGDAYLVMELLVGRDLEAELRARGRLPVQEAVDYVLQACEGVAEAHAVGLVHRDLKPANLFLTRRRDGSALVKVLDFGISKRTLGGIPTTLTNRSAACGTPAYMAPEQMLPITPVDARCDQHALAVVLFELIAGRRVFSADSLCALSAQILDQPAPRLGDFVPAAPAGLTAAIARALAKKPGDRFPDLTGFARAIAPFGGPGAAASARNVARVLEGAPSSRRAPCPSLPAGPASRAPTPITASAPVRGRRVARVTAAALSASVALVAAIGGIGALLDRTEPLPLLHAEAGLARAARGAPAPALAPPGEASPARAAAVTGAVLPPAAEPEASRPRGDADAARRRPPEVSAAPRPPAAAKVAPKPAAKGTPKAAPKAAPRATTKTPPAPAPAPRARKSAREVFGDR